MHKCVFNFLFFPIFVLSFVFYSCNASYTNNENVEKTVFSIQTTFSEPSNGIEIISVVPSCEDITQYKFAIGEKAAEWFGCQGVFFNPEQDGKLNIKVTENSIYTIYAKNSTNEECISVVSVSNLDNASNNYIEVAYSESNEIVLKKDMGKKVYNLLLKQKE